MATLFSQLVKPGIKRLVNEVFAGVQYLLSQQEYEELVTEEVVTRRFALGWDALILPFKVKQHEGVTDGRMILRQVIFKVF